MIFWHFHGDHYGYTLFFQQSRTHKKTKKSNVWLSMLFFHATFGLWDHFGIWYIMGILISQITRIFFRTLLITLHWSSWFQSCFYFICRTILSYASYFCIQCTSLIGMYCNALLHAHCIVQLLLNIIDPNYSVLNWFWWELFNDTQHDLYMFTMWCAHTVHVRVKIA